VIGFVGWLSFFSWFYVTFERFVRFLVKEISASNLIIFSDIVAYRGHRSIPLAPIDNRV
jgi:hypothetical protein